ncbi:MAG: twin-arginine translocation signal domain-containing protein [Nanobdellota archaeon]
MTEQVDLEALAQKYSRRDFLKFLGLGTLAGVTTGGFTYGGIGWIENKVLAFTDVMGKEFAELATDLDAVKGALEKKISMTAQPINERYQAGQLAYLKDLGYLEGREYQDFGRVLEQLEDIESHYGLVERLRVFKQKFDTRISDLDNYVEENLLSKVPVFGSINDGIRDLFNRPTGKDGKLYRAEVRTKLHYLSQLYDINEDNREAQVKVVHQIRDWLDDTGLEPGERRLLSFLHDQYIKTGQEESLKGFIKQYTAHSEAYVEKEKLTALRNGIETMETQVAVFENLIDASRVLYADLQKGIELKTMIRETAPADLASYEAQIRHDYEEIAAQLSRVQRKLEDEGLVDEPEQVFSATIQSYFDPIKYFTSLAVGLATVGYVGIEHFFKNRHKREARRWYKAGKELEMKYNSLLEEQNENQGMSDD